MKIPAIATVLGLVKSLGQSGERSSSTRSNPTSTRLDAIDRYVSDISSVLVIFSSKEFIDVLKTMNDLFNTMDDRFETTYDLSRRMHDLYVTIDDELRTTDGVTDDVLKTMNDLFNTMDDLLDATDDLLKTVDDGLKTTDDVLKTIYDAQKRLDDYTVLHVDLSLRSRIEEECARLERASRKALALGPPGILEPIQSEIITISELHLTFIDHLRKGLEYEDSIEFGAIDFREHMMFADPMMFANHSLDHIKRVQNLLGFTKELKPESSENLALHRIAEFLENHKHYRCLSCTDVGQIETELEETEARLTTFEAMSDYLAVITRQLDVIETTNQTVAELCATYDWSDSRLLSMIESEYDEQEQACKNIIQLPPPLPLASAHGELRIAIDLNLDALTIQRSLLAHDGEELDEEIKLEMVQLAEETGTEISDHLDRFHELVGRARESME